MDFFFQIAPIGNFEYTLQTKAVHSAGLGRQCGSWFCVLWGDGACGVQCLLAELLRALELWVRVLLLLGLGWFVCVRVCAMLLLTPAALFFINKWVTVPSSIKRKRPSLKQQTSPIHTCYQIFRWKLVSEAQLLVLKLTLYCIHFNTEDSRRRFCLWK